MVNCFYFLELVNLNPCYPSPCGPNSRCKEINGQAACSCAPNMIGSPPACHPECIISAECQLDQACSNQKCISPCNGACGINAECKVVNHNPICSCPGGLTGDPFSRCFDLRKYIITPRNILLVSYLIQYNTLLSFYSHDCI